MKSHLLLLRWVLDETGTWCRTSTSLDLKRIEARVKAEGLSFLTITLPQFGRDLERALDQGEVDSTLFVGFSKRGCLPRLFSGFTSLIFDSHSGRLLDEPSIDAIQSLRQITLMFGKLNLPCSDARVNAALRQYVECEKQVSSHDWVVTFDEYAEFRKMGMTLWSKVFSVLDRKVWLGEIVPKHGPGATADRLKGNRKYDQRVWTRRLDPLFPVMDFVFPSVSHFLDSPDIPLLEPEAELPVRVITVPKTLKTPRIIAIEPTCMQYVQQGLMEVIVDTIQRDDILGSIVGFDDQEPNQLMASKASHDGSLATLDLSEASDRVSNQLVRLLTCYWPHASEAIDACRSRNADVPGFGVIPLSKFASMGSALCFPIEAMVFTTIIFLGIQDELRRPLTLNDIESFRGRVRVYGDDIIVPVDYVHSVVRRLEAFGFLINRSKSFWTGKFRESCGKEYYDGSDVSIVRVREALPTQQKHARTVVSSVSLRNQLYFAGYWKTARHMDEYLERIIPFPSILPHSSALGRHTLLGSQTDRVCPFLHRPLVKAYVVYGRAPKSNLEGSGALLKWFLKRGDKPFADRDHLERAGRPDAVDIKLRWVSPV